MSDPDFQRLLFEYGRQCRERGVDAPYDFIVLDHRPRSFTATADRDRLAHRGVLVHGAWHLTAVGHRLAEDVQNRDMAAFMARFRSETGGPRLGRMHLGPVEHGDRDGASSTYGRNDDALLVTIGYEMRSYEAYFNELLRSRISRLCDVRRNPISRKWGFSKRLLSHGCKELGIRYASFPELGIESAQRTGLSGRAAFNCLFAEYKATTLSRCQGAVAKITGWVDVGKRVAITCYERDPRDCHRSHLADAIVATAAHPVKLRHL